MFGRQQSTDNADLGIHFIQCPVRFDPDIVFIHSFATMNSGAAVISSTRVYSHFYQI